MTVDEIFANMTAHMVKGFMLHQDLANYYDFLNLHGFKRCHEYHYFCESISHRRLYRYYVNHYNKLVPYQDIRSEDVIPESWYRYTRQDVDANTKKNAVKSGVEQWVKWEQATKAQYQEWYKELLDMGEVAAAMEISQYISDADDELKRAQRKHMELASVGYDLAYIGQMQDALHDKYKAKMECLVVAA